MLLSHRQNAEQNHSINIANRCFENVAQLKYLHTTVTNQNMIQKEIKRRLNSGNGCYLSVQNLLSSHLLSKNVKIKIYKLINLHVVLYGCETLSLTLRENRVLTRIFWPKRDNVTGGWRKLHDDELHNLYSSPKIVRMIKRRRMRWAGHVARKGAKMYVCGILVGKPEGKRPLGRLRRRWVDSIKMDLNELEWDGIDWIDLAQNSD
jgi:hypothetical protein